MVRRRDRGESRGGAVGGEGEDGNKGDPQRWGREFQHRRPYPPPELEKASALSDLEPTILLVFRVKEAVVNDVDTSRSRFPSLPGFIS